MGRKALYVLICLVLVIGLVLGACAKPAPAPAPAPKPAPKAEPIVIEAIMPTTVGSPSMEPWRWWVKRVEELSHGELTIDILGGSEIMPGRDQTGAIADGVFDISPTLAGWAEKVVLPIGMFYQRRIPPDEMRSRGAYDLLKEEAAKAGIYYVGPAGELLDGSYYYSTNKAVKTPYELKGQRVTTFATMTQWVDALGMDALLVAPADRYTSIERGLANGQISPVTVWFHQGYYEVTDHWIDHGVYSTTTNILMNLDKYNSLPGHLQDVIDQANLDLEEVAEEMTARIANDAKKQLIEEGGMTPITFSPEDAKYYVELAYTARWEFLHEQYPDWAPRLFELWGTP